MGRKVLVPIVPDGGWGWVVVIASFFIHVFADGFVYSFGISAVEIREEFNASASETSLIIALLTGLTLGCGPIASALTNRYGCRTTTIVGAVVATTGCFVSRFATSSKFFVGTVGVVMGFGFGLIYCPAIVIVTMYFEKWRALATGLAVCGAGFGTLIFSPLSGFIIRNYGWRANFLSFTFVVAACALCGATFRPLQFMEKELDENGETVDGKKDKETPFVEGDDRPKETDNLLSASSQADRLRAHSHSNVNSSQGDGKLRATISAFDVAPGNRARAVSEAKAEGYIDIKDVFYTGSITALNEFRKNPDKYRSMTSLSSRHKDSKVGEVKEDKSAVKIVTDDDDKEPDSEASTGSFTFVYEFLQTVNSMLNLSLLADPAFLLFAISNLLTSVGFNSPLFFLPMHAEKIGIPKEKADWILGVFGICNTGGRIFFGSISDHALPLPYGLGKDRPRNRLWIYNLSLAVCGLLTAMCFAFDGFHALCVYSGLFGFSISSYICLTSVITVDLLSLEQLTNAFGLLLLFQGIGTVGGPPVAGALADLTGTYTWSFVFCGVCLFVSGVMLFSIPLIRRHQNRESSPDSLDKKLPIVH